MSKAVSESIAILVVEDEPAVLKVVASMLLHAGYRVLEAPTVDAARAAYSKHYTSIRLVIADVGMAGTRHVVDHFANGIPFLYVSGYSREDLVRRGALAPETSFLQKPFDLPHLLCEVERTLSPASGSARAAE